MINMHSVLVLILAVYGTHANIPLLLDNSLFDYESTSQTPTGVPSTTSECTVSGMAGACVQSRVFCKTPNTGAETITFRSTRSCGTGVCCKLSDVIPTSIGTAIKTSTSTTGTTRPTIRTTSTATGDTTPTSAIITRLGPTPSSTPVKAGCGWRNPQGVGSQTTKVTEGEANFGEFPWMVVILRPVPVNQDDPSGEQRNIFSGGGSLIHMNVVLTTAHYVVTAEKLKVRAGEWDTLSTEEIYPSQDRDVEKKEIHRDFIRGILYYDVALLFLNKPMDPAPHIGVVCLPTPKRLQQEGTRCFTSGWGKDKFGNAGHFQRVLKKLELPVVKHTTCQRLLRNTKLGGNFELHRSFMCAGGEADIDTCKGDGGSPLVCPIKFEPNRYVLAGMTSWGIGCGEHGTPGVYVDVSVVRDWIDDKIGGNGYADEMTNAAYIDTR